MFTQIDGGSVKAAYRHALACSHLGAWHESKQSLDKVLAAEPGNVGARRELRLGRSKQLLLEGRECDAGYLADGRAFPATSEKNWAPLGEGEGGTILLSRSFDPTHQVVAVAPPASTPPRCATIGTRQIRM